MITYSKVWLNDEALHNIDSSILVQSITESEPEVNLPLTTRMYGGSLAGAEARKSLEVSIDFVIVQRDPRVRSGIIQKIRAWASSEGLLALSTHPDQQLRVRCTQYPMESTKWLDSLTVVFTAYAVPWWEDAYTNITEGKTSGNSEVELMASGTTRSPMDVTITNDGSNTCNSVTITTRDGSFELRSLGLAPNEVLTIGHDTKGLMYIQIASASGVVRSAYDKRTKDSMDEIWMYPSGNTVRIATDTQIKYQFTTRGRWI